VVGFHTGHPDVDSSDGPGAAVVAAPHAKWGERPILAVKVKAGADASREDLLAFYDGKVAKWWIPDDVVFLDAIPATATGKISKLELRKVLADYVHPDER